MHASYNAHEQLPWDCTKFCMQHGLLSAGILCCAALALTMLPQHRCQPATRHHLLKVISSLVAGLVPIRCVRLDQVTDEQRKRACCCPLILPTNA